MSTLNDTENTTSFWQKPTAWLLAGIVGLIVILGFSFVGVSNGLNHSQQNVDSATGDIQAALQNRADTIPNLVNAVKGSQGQESKVFGEIAQARTQYNKAKSDYDSAKTQDDKTSAMQSQQKAMDIMVSSINENYPDLQSNQQMSALMSQIEDSNNRVSYQRLKYNQAVKDYNNKVVSFPSSVVAGMTGHTKLNYFAADTQAQANPTVQF